MEGWWLVSYIAMWVLLLVVAIFNIAVLRQLGLLYVRLGGSLGALQTAEGPEVGDEIPVSEVHDKFGVVRSLVPSTGKHKVLVFMSPTCEICDPMIPHVPSFTRSLRKDAELLVVLTAEDRSGKFGRWKPNEPPVVVDQTLGDLFALPAMPYGVVIDEGGKVASKGVINDLVQVESLLTDAETREDVELTPTGGASR